jgi:SGNH hydrolase-like domain, acetyltransferase AlgX
MRTLSLLQVGIWITAVVIAIMFYMLVFDASLFQENCALGPVTINSEMTAENGLYRSEDQTLALKMITLDFKLDHSTDYAVAFTIREVKTEIPIRLTVDFYGSGYDKPEQQFQMNLTTDMKDKQVVEIINSGQAAPEKGMLRLFYAAAGTLAISDVSIIGGRRKVIRDFRRSLVAVALFLVCLIWLYVKSKPERKRLTPVQKIQVVIIGIFMIMIMAPILQEEFRIVKYPSLDENRRRLEPPPGNMLTTLYQEGTEYSQAYEKYFNDTYGFRDFLIQLKNQLDYMLFKRSDDVVIGEAGYMDYKSVIAVEEVRGERYTQKQWEQVYANFRAFHTYLKDRGITLVLLPIQMKFSIYPEHYPQNYVNRPNHTAFDRLLKYFDDHPEYVYINAREILWETKREQPVFYQTDFHWNEIGAFKVSEAVVNALGEMSGRDTRWQHDLKFKRKPGFDGGVNRSLAVFYPPLEDKIELETTWTQQTEMCTPEPPFRLHYRATQPQKNILLPKTVVIGNSFVFYYLENNGFFEYFEEAYLYHNDDLKYFANHIPAGTKYVVFQFLETDLGNWLWVDKSWPDYKKQVQRSENKK